MAPLSLSGVQKSYGAHAVIKDVDLDIADGEFVILVGPSGCGKSTLLRMIAGLEKITGGDIRIGGRAVNDVPPKERDVAMVFQTYALYPHMSVAENMGFSLRLAKSDKATIAERVRKAADILALGPLLERLPKQLSGGQRQRVAMGRAIVRDPKVFLFDEPLSNLDAKLRVQMRAEIKSLHQRLKTTMVYVTHDQIEAMTMADRIVVMNGGQVEQVGRPLDLYNAPRNLFVAAFIGSPSMNLLEGDIVSDKAELMFRSKGGTLLPLPEGAMKLNANRRIVYGIRPEHIHLGDVAATHGMGIISVIEPMGSETQLVVKLGEDDLVVVLRDHLAGGPGDVLPIRIQPERVHLFDAESQQRFG
ncbi:ABC transporter ATP-binding protein [uncultured Aureimonas sp.]|uniref:ABC transporter ATP-binding protein n=1 Tax=uncultured Aureimonas sp. TaxID=1604662 RepID=UPI0025DE2EC8|nr:sn-glycerol-3-phosphate ABC transporter ATP-binding protein UgpC [uncultured Aureimonas sp.]